MRPLNIVIIAAVDLPEGGGETTRLKTLASAIKAGGHQVNILLENPSGNIDEANLKVSGETDGIPFRYILGNVHPLKGASFFTGKYKAVKLMLSAIKEMHQQRPVDVIWLNQMAFHTIYPITRLAAKLGIKTVQSYEDDRSKGPGLKRKVIYTNQVAADKYLTSRADGLVVISRHLQQKYTQLSGGNVPVIIIPTVLDTGKWAAGPEKKNNIPTLLYYGAFFGFDEVEKMIEAVGILRKKNVAVQLWLLGYNRRKPEYMEALAAMARQLGLEKQVDFKGFTRHDKLKDYIQESNILIGLRKDDEWSSTGLSTKLSEYLATGRMVICTAIGDNTWYLKDGESAMLMRPGCTATELSVVIETAINDDALRAAIGAAGRQVAISNFDMNVVKENINKLLYSIVTRK